MSTLAIIQARYSSTRFPGKALADLHGKPVIQHVYERMQGVATLDDVIVAFPINEANSPLLQWALDNKVNYVGVHGDESDVLRRYCRVADGRPDAQAILRVTGDCPMVDPNMCRKLVKEWRASGCEYGWLDTHSVGGWPDGLDCEVFTRALLFRAHRRAKSADDREHVTPWMRRNADVYSMPMNPWYIGWPKCSIDTPEDLERVRQMMAVQA